MSTPRKTPRHRARVKVEVQLADQPRALRTFTHDVSAFGLFVKGRRVADPGTVVAVTADLPCGETAQIQGRIARIDRADPRLAQDRGGFGVEIEQADEAWFRYMCELDEAKKRDKKVA